MGSMTVRRIDDEIMRDLRIGAGSLLECGIAIGSRAVE